MIPALLPKKIVLVGKDGIQRKQMVGGELGYDRMLKRFDGEALVNEEGYEVNDFQSLVDGALYDVIPKQPTMTLVKESTPADHDVAPDTALARNHPQPQTRVNKMNKTGPTKAVKQLPTVVEVWKEWYFGVDGKKPVKNWSLDDYRRVDANGKCRYIYQQRSQIYTFFSILDKAGVSPSEMMYLLETRYPNAPILALARDLHKGTLHQDLCA